jgi:hypothetical protein
MCQWHSRSHKLHTEIAHTSNFTCRKRLVEVIVLFTCLLGDVSLVTFLGCPSGAGQVSHCCSRKRSVRPRFTHPVSRPFDHWCAFDASFAGAGSLCRTDRHTSECLDNDVPCTENAQAGLRRLLPGSRRIEDAFDHPLEIINTVSRSQGSSHDLFSSANRVYCQHDTLWRICEKMRIRRNDLHLNFPRCQSA